MVDEAAAARWGIQTHYLDALWHERHAPDAAVDHVLAGLLGPDGDVGAGPPAGPLTFVQQGSTALPEQHRGNRLTTEDGADLGPVDDLPPDLPPGYHRLTDIHGQATTLVVHPYRCFLPEDLRAWGWALQLHADRSTGSWGIGDLGDARSVGEWSNSRGGHPVLLLSPLHAPNLHDHPAPSPYYASSRCFRNPLALRIDRVPGAAAGAGGPEVDLADLAAAGRALNEARLIDRDAVWALKRSALERIWAATRPSARPAADAALSADPVLGAFARFTTALEAHGPCWTRWPGELRHPSGPGWSRFGRDQADRIAFHAWCQQLVTDQLAALQATVPVMHDLAIGTDPLGFDAWFWQELFVLDGTRVGAPADEFNTLGQDWGLPPLDPWRLRSAGYEPFLRMLRSAMAVGSGLRIDHVMGLFRLFWIPPEMGAADGVYVRQPTDDLLALVALESERAGAYVVGEDLGTVEPGVREVLADRRLMSYRVMALDDAPVDHYPTDSLASVGTHDLATVAGLWSGQDLADQQALGMDPPVDATHEQRRRFGERIGVGQDAPIGEVVVAAHRQLGEAGSRIVLGQLEDAALVPERPNMPGTSEGWPNWSLALPDPLEVVLATDLAAEVADAMRGTPDGHQR